MILKHYTVLDFLMNKYYNISHKIFEICNFNYIIMYINIYISIYRRKINFIQIVVIRDTLFEISIHDNIVI